jgi:hypothetical protein
LKAAGKVYDTDTAAPSDTNNTLNYDGILRSSQLFEGSTRVLTAATGNILDASITDGNLTYAPYAVGDKSAGRIYSGTTDPTDTTRLNYDGIIYASKFIPTNGSELIRDYPDNTNFSLALSDSFKLINLTNSSAVIITVPLNSAVPFPIGTEIAFFRGGDGSVRIIGETSGGTVTIESEGSPSTPKNYIKAKYTSAAIKKIATNKWILVGNLSAT